jgi:phage baseplate assembly protein gpV
VNATSQVFEHVLQMGQSNWDFLWQMAARIGYEVFFHDGKLHFIEPQTSPGDTISLQWGKELLSFHARMTASHQVSSVKVRGWDSKQQKEIIGQAATSSLYPSVGESRNGKAIADAAFSATDLDVVDLPVVDQSEANALAQAVFDGTAGEFLQAEGTTTFGIASLLPRCLVDIGSVGTKFGGTYFVTSTVHRFNGIDGYTTSFSVSGTRPGSLYGMIAGDSPVPPVRRIEGVVPAKVTNNNDPDGIGRVKVSFPWMGESIESNWVRIASPDAGNERGFHFTPEIDDEVLISFEFGDVQRPYVIGSLWSAKQKPPQPTSDAVANGKVNVRMIKTRAGHIIKLDDTSGSEKIEIIDRTGKNTIVIDSSANTLDINVDADITITPGGKCTIKATGDISIESSGNIAMKAGGNFDLEATGNMTIKGMQLSAEGQTKAELKGAMVGVTGSAMAEIKAGLVKIN